MTTQLATKMYVPTKTHNILSVEEELSLAKDFYETGNTLSAQKLILSHLRFVSYIVKSYQGFGFPEDDLVQEGNVGLMKAVKRFNPHLGFRLSTFAIHWIKAEIHEFIIRNWGMVKIATTKAQRKLFFNLSKHKQKIQHLGEVEANKISKALNVTTKDVFEMDGRMTSYNISIGHDGADSDDSGVFHTAIQDALDDNRYNPELLCSQIQEQNIISPVADIVNSLDPRSKNIITKRWLVEEKSTLKDLALEYGISFERVRQIETKALNKIKEAVISSGYVLQ